MRDAMLHPERYSRDGGSPFPNSDYDLPDPPKCCGVWMQDDGTYFYCDECGKEVAK